MFTNVPSEEWFALPLEGAVIRFEALNATRFTAITNFPAGGVLVEVAGGSYGPFGYGQSFSFAGFPSGGVTNFSVRPTSGVIPATVPFQLAFNGATGAFRARISGPAGVPVSMERLSVGGAPTGEVTNSVTLFEHVRFTARVTGVCQNTYQWCQNFAPLPGQTNQSLTISNLTAANRGAYSVIVANELGVVESRALWLVVLGEVLGGEALESPELAWITGGAAPWTAQALVTHDGVDAAQSGAISHNQESWVQTSVNGPGSLSFWWKVSSESGYDYLECYTNDVRVTRIAGEVDWQKLNYELGTGTHVLRWRYMKDGGTSSGQDRGWVDQVSFMPPSGPPVVVIQPTNQTVIAGGTASFAVSAGGALPLAYQWRYYGTNLVGQTNHTLVLQNVTTKQIGPYAVVVTNASGSVTSTAAFLTLPDSLALGVALDVPDLTWSVGGNAVWTPQTSVTHDGADAAQSGAISHNQESWMQTSVNGPGSLSFWWKASSESGYDYLEFYTNDVRVTRIAGEVDWQKLSYALGTGIHVLRWRYMKDGSVSSGQDRGWVDEVAFAPLSGRPVIFTNDSHFGLRSNRFGFNVSGTPGQVLIVEGSTNLLNWLPLQTNTLGGGQSYFSDPVPSVFPWRFYRVRIGP